MTLTSEKQQIAAATTTVRHPDEFRQLSARWSISFFTVIAAAWP